MPHFGRGLVYAAQGRSEQAIQEMQRALALQPDLAVAHKELGRIFWAQRQFQLAETHYRKAIELEPEMASAYLGLGLNFASQRDFPNALEQFQRAIELAPDLPSAYHSLGQTYAWMGDLPKAIEAYQTAIRLEPNNPAPYYELGVAYMQLKDYPKAVSALENVVKLQPRHKSAHYNLAQAYAKVGKLNQAEAETGTFEELHQVDEETKPHRRTLEGAPEDLKARYAIAQVYAKHGWMEEVLEQCELLLSIQPDFVPAYIAIIQLHQSQKQLLDARSWAQQLTQVQPKLSLGYYYLGLISAELGFVDATVEAYQKAISLEPNSPSAYNNLAWFYAERNMNLDAAVALCQKAIQIAPKASYIDTLAQIYYKQGRYEDALLEMSKVIQSTPENPTYIQHWEMIKGAARKH